jgi:hypothetical protein
MRFFVRLAALNPVQPERRRSGDRENAAVYGGLPPGVEQVVASHVLVRGKDGPISYWVSPPKRADSLQTALKYKRADAPTSTRTSTSIKMAGSNTTRSALPVVVPCISRIPTVAR